MIEQKISEITQVTDCQDTDLLIISRPDGLGGFDSYSMIGKAIDNYVRPYLKVEGLITQNSTSAPTAVEAVNDIEPFTYKRIGVGHYEIVSPNLLFTTNRTWVMFNTGGQFGYVRAWWETTEKVRIETYNTSFVQADDILEHVAFEIRVY